MLTHGLVADASAWADNGAAGGMLVPAKWDGN